MKVGNITKREELESMKDEDLLEISGMTQDRLEEVRSFIPSLVTSESPENATPEAKSITDDSDAGQESEDEVFSQADLEEFGALNEDSELESESEEVEPKKDVSDDDIWNIDSIVKKNRKKKPQKGVIRFAEDIEDLRK